VIRCVYGYDAPVAAWVAARISTVGAADDFGPCIAIGVVNGDHMVAGVVFNKYYPDCRVIDLNMAAVSPVWARWPIIIELLSYPFLQLGVNVVQTVTPHTNKAALEVNKHIGFRQEAVLRHRFGREHAVVCSMLRREFDRLVKEHSHRQEVEPQAA